MTSPSVRICRDLWAGPYVDKPGAVLLLGDRIVHLDPGQCARLAQVLTSAAQDPNPRKVT